MTPSLADLVDWLEAWAEETGEPAFLQAARAVHQQAPGRPAKHDARLIEEAIWLIETGGSPSLNAALSRVAATVPGNPRSTAERLRRKIRAEARKVSTK